MALDPELVAMMPHTITVYEMSSFNDYGEPAYSTSGSTYTAMIEERPEIVRAAFGEEVVTSHIVYVNSTSRIDMTARIVLNTDGSEPPLIRSDVFYDETGEVHHAALFFGGGPSGG